MYWFSVKFSRVTLSLFRGGEFSLFVQIGKLAKIPSRVAFGVSLEPIWSKVLHLMAPNVSLNQSTKVLVQAGAANTPKFEFFEEKFANSICLLGPKSEHHCENFTFNSSNLIFAIFFFLPVRPDS